MLNINRGSARSSYEQEEKTDMKILMVLTSHSELGNTGKNTGFWLEASVNTQNRPYMIT